MPQLIVRNIEDKVVQQLRLRAASHGISMEEEHRRLLRSVLLAENSDHPSFVDMLLAIPKASANEPIELFARQNDIPRTIDL